MEQIKRKYTAVVISHKAELYIVGKTVTKNEMRILTIGLEIL